MRVFLSCADTLFPCVPQRNAGDLMIRNIQLHHGGKYVCIVDTDVESLSVDAVLIVKGKNLNLGFKSRSGLLCCATPIRVLGPDS